MDFSQFDTRGLVLLGCGKMGSALLDGWLDGGLPPSAATVIDPHPSEDLERLAGQGLRLNATLPAAPAAVLLAVKPQMMTQALPKVSMLGRADTVFISIAAGTTLATLEAGLGSETPIVRTMPNTPAAIGRGITALVANASAPGSALDLAEGLLGTVGQTVRLDSEELLDAVTAVSGSGPAYVFLLIEALAAAGEAEGLAPRLALALARATVAGAGALAESSELSPEDLRVNVTSPGGTTAAALGVLMREGDGLPELIGEAVRRAAARSRELATQR
jgi:pyrroline-5-carboxylate reductase